MWALTMKITLLCIYFSIYIQNSISANAINFRRPNTPKNVVFPKGFHIGNQAKLPLTKRSGLTSRDGWRPVIYPGFTNNNHNSRTVALNIPIFDRKIQRHTKNEFIINPALNIHKDPLNPIQNREREFNNIKLPKKEDQLPSIVNDTKIINHESDIQNRKIDNLLLESIKNKNEELEMINKKLQKTLDDFISKFNKMVEVAVFNSTQQLRNIYNCVTELERFMSKINVHVNVKMFRDRFERILMAHLTCRSTRAKDFCKYMENIKEKITAGHKSCPIARKNPQTWRASKASISDINHPGGGQGQSDAPPPTEAGYKGPPVLNANSTGGTLDYREEEDTEPSTQETGDSGKQSKSKRDHRYHQPVDINTTINEPQELARSGRGVRKTVYPLGHSWPYLGSNSPDHSPPDPYVALFLSHYGRYLPSGRGFGSGFRNLYSYLASNNLHNNKPFGSYKIYEDSDS